MTETSVVSEAKSQVAVDATAPINNSASSQINKYLMDQQGQQSQPINFFPAQNPSYAAQPSSSTSMMQHHQQDSTSSNNAEQVLQQLLQQQVDLQNQVNAQMQLNATTNSTNKANIQAHQAQQAQLSSSAGYYPPAHARPHHQQPGDSDLMNLWQQIGSDTQRMPAFPTGRLYPDSFYGLASHNTGLL